MKVKKTSVLVSLVIAAVCLIAGLIIMFLPNNSPDNSPVAVSEKIRVHSSSGYIFFEGKIKNVTDETATITCILVDVNVSDGDIIADITKVIELQPGAELDLSDYYLEDWGTAYGVNELVVTVNGQEYTVYKSMPLKTVGAVVLYIIAAIFGFAALSAFIRLNRTQKRYNSIEEALGKAENNAVFMVGNYGKAGDAGKAAAKTATSVIGGVLSTLFLGAGYYRFYGVDNQHEFVLTDEGLYAGKPGKGDINLSNMMLIGGNCFKDFNVSVKKKQVVLSHKVNGDVITLNLTDHKTLTAEAVSERINALSAAAEAAASAPAPEPATAEESPFEEL